MATPHELLTANLHDVFGNRDPGSRRKAIHATYTADVSFSDPDETVTGLDALEAKAAAVIEGAPADFVFAPVGLEYTSPDSGALAWEFGPAGNPVARGIDVITVRDGRISALRTMLHS